jgi:hypothetical protein
MSGVELLWRKRAKNFGAKVPENDWAFVIVGGFRASSLFCLQPGERPRVPRMSPHKVTQRGKWGGPAGYLAAVRRSTVGPCPTKVEALFTFYF